VFAQAQGMYGCGYKLLTRSGPLGILAIIINSPITAGVA